jgi:hypothetical protein
MNYQRIYNEIVNSAKGRGLDKSLIHYYTEKHHIIPKCVGGDNSSNNLVLLTGREHYLCHWLLWRINKDNKLLFYPFHMMTFLNTTKSGNKRYELKLSSKQYDKIRSQLSEIKKTEVPGFLGKKHSDESNLKNSLAHKGSNHINFGKHLSESTRNKIGNAHRGKVTLESTKEKLRAFNLGKKYSLEARKHMSNCSSFSKKVSINSIIYKTKREACKNLKLGINTLNKRIKLDSYPNYFEVSVED